MNLIALSFKSWKERKISVALAVLSITLASTLFFSVEKIRAGIQYSFANTISDTDLVVGPRSSALQVLLSSIFQTTVSSNMMSYKTFLHFKNHPQTEWAVPLSFGDNYRGNRMIGTVPEFFKYYRYHHKKNLSFAEGHAFAKLYDVVLGAKVAKEFSLGIGSKIILAHGMSQTSLMEHSDSPFTVVGVLERTNTPIDRSVLVSLQAVEAIHQNWQSGMYQQPEPSAQKPKEKNVDDFKIKKVSNFLLKCKSPLDILVLQREIDGYDQEPLSAAIPAMTLAQLWKNLGSVETALFSLSVLAGVISLLSVLIVITSSLAHRRREIAILRSLGAGGALIFFLLAAEALALTFTGLTLGLLFTYGGIFLFQSGIESLSGVYVSLTPPAFLEILFITLMLIAAFVLSALPGILAYRMSLRDGLTVKM